MSFPLIGNVKIKQALTNAVGAGHIPHAVIIEGDTGTGRHTLAHYIAAAAVCEGENPPCGECKGCRLSATGNHPDIGFTSPEDGKKNISVAQIRALRSEAFVKPHMSSKRVFVIDGADTMNEQSQNALLKVLEEPPESVIFVLVAQTKAALLETVISRCVTLTLNAPEYSEAKEYLLKNTDFSADSIDVALAAAQNNIGQALKALSGEEESPTAAAAEEFLRCLRESDLWGMLKAVSIAEKNRVSADCFFKDLKYRTACCLRADPGAYTARAYSRLYSQLCELEKSLASNINLGLLSCLLVSRAAEIIK